MDSPHHPVDESERRTALSSGDLHELEALRERLDNFAGTFPDPEFLVDLERLSPGSVERLLRQLELEQLYRHEQREALLQTMRWESRSRLFAITAAFALAALMLALAAYLIGMGFGTEGLFVVALQTTAFIGVFLAGRTRRQRDRGAD